MKDPYAIVKNPISTEKAVRLMESENKLLFAVSKKATKKEIKEALKIMFKIKIEKVNTLILPNGKKRAYVKLSNETPAIDIATELGML
tara:strand:+ start:90 stop:353 length:264 start_codon:yes stop_codon:yes gene_type:complete